MNHVPITEARRPAEGTIANPSRPPKQRVLGAFLTPRYLLARTLMVSFLFGVVQLAGWRDYTTFLTGAAARAGGSLPAAAGCGSIYILLYLGFVVLAPVMAIAAGLLVFWEKVQPVAKSKL